MAIPHTEFILQFGRPFTVGAGSVKIQIVSAKGKALVDLEYQRRMWTEFEKPFSEVRGNRLTEVVVSFICPRRPYGVLCGKDLNKVY